MNNLRFTNLAVFIALFINFISFTLEASISKIRFGKCHNIGRRISMEDAAVAKIYFDQPYSALFAIFDGHGGSAVAQYCANNLDNILQGINGKPAERLRQGLLELNQKVKTCDIAQNAQVMGTCAIVALIEGNNLAVANIGDSRAILSRNGKAVALSQDQNPSRSDEKARIEKAGGNVIFGRVNGVLAVSRAIGDYFLESSGLVAIPEIETVTFDPLKDFLILACDGIFEGNILTRQDAVDIVSRSLAQNSDNINAEEIAAQTLVNTAYVKGSGDNLSAIVVRFGR